MATEQHLEALNMGLRGIVTSIILSSLVSCLVVLGGGWAIVSTVFDVHLQTTHPGAARIMDVSAVGNRILDGQARVITRLDRIEALINKYHDKDD